MERFFNWTTTNEGMLATVTSLTVYFAPIKGVIIVVFAAIVLDLILGVWAARSKGEGIKPIKLWRTLYKLLIAFAVLHLMFSIDIEFNIGINTYKITGLIIVLFEVWSILESATQITNHRVFRYLQKYMEDKTQVDFNEDGKIDKITQNEKHKQDPAD